MPGRPRAASLYALSHDKKRLNNVFNLEKTMALCKYCDADIQFEKNKWDRWITLDPGTGRRHECQLEQRCELCNKPFMGAPYKKKCPPCFKNSQPGREGFRDPKTSESGNFGDPGSRSTSRYHTKVYPPKKAEALKNDGPPADDGFDDIPF